jgi:hypothetical protein
VAPGAALGKVEHHGLQRIEHRRAVAPEVGAVRLAVTRFQHRHRRLVSVQHRSAQQFGLQRVYQRLQLHAAGSYPLRQRRARQRQAGAPEDAFLSVQR